jgi:hypothetical protein
VTDRMADLEQHSRMTVMLAVNLGRSFGLAGRKTAFAKQSFAMDQHRLA